MNLLGLDLASRLTGWCCGDGSGLPDCGAWRFPSVNSEDGVDYGLLLTTLDNYLGAAHATFRFGAVAYEAPILISGRRSTEWGYGDSLAKLRLLYPLGAFVEYWCHQRDIACFEVSVSAIKKELTGNRRAEKADMVAIAQKVGLKLPLKSHGADDAADAFGAWLLLLRSYDKDASSRFDQAIWTPRGALF